MAGFPSGVEIERVGQVIDQARSAKPEVVRATIAPPAIYRDGRYVLDARFIVWADDPAGATGLVEDLLAGAGIACRLVVPSGRSLGDTEVPRPRAARSGKARAKAKTARRKPAAKPRRAPARRSRTAAKSARSGSKGRRPSAKKRRSR
jgi:hypothetical protein